MRKKRRNERRKESGSGERQERKDGRGEERRKRRTNERKNRINKTTKRRSRKIGTMDTDATQRKGVLKRGHALMTTHKSKPSWANRIPPHLEKPLRPKMTIMRANRGGAFNRTTITHYATSGSLV